MIERELKYSSPSDNIPSLAELEPILFPYKLNPAKIYHIYDRYFDNSLASLEKAGVALRKRLINKKRLVTLKQQASNHDSYFQREEIELEQKGSNWPEVIVDIVSMHCDVSSLRKVVEFKTRRVSYKIESERDIAVVSFDKVSARLPGKEGSVDFFEVEIEAIGETTKAELEKIAALLGKVIMLSVNTGNKLNRAKALLGLGL